MNAFDRKMAEQVALVTTLAIDINQLSTEFTVEIEFRGNVNALVIRFNNAGVYPKVFGKVRVYYILRMETFFEAEYQEYPFRDCCTIEQMIDVLHQTRQALIEGRTHEQHNSAADHEHRSTTSMDEQNGTDGALLTEPASLCHGSVERAGCQQENSISPMA